VILDTLSEADTWVSLLTLTALEVVLGIDNVIFLSILAGKLPAEQQVAARRWGLSLALVFRVGLLFALAWVMGLTRPLFSLLGHGFSGRDLILLGGGLFLVAKSTHEIFDRLETPQAAAEGPRPSASFGAVLVADGMGQHLPKGYLYFAMGFSFAVELLNLRLRHAAPAPSTPPGGA
jgi:predicted tellurium resistance membrane protein TerC